jgi:hypothetical protein
MYGGESGEGISRTDQVLVLLNRLHQGPVASFSNSQIDGLPSAIQTQKPWDAFASVRTESQGRPFGPSTTQPLLGPASQDPTATVYKSLAVVLGDQRRSSTVRQLRYKSTFTVLPQLNYIVQTHLHFEDRLQLISYWNFRARLFIG